MTHGHGLWGPLVVLQLDRRTYPTSRGCLVAPLQCPYGKVGRRCIVSYSSGLYYVDVFERRTGAPDTVCLIMSIMSCA